MLSDLQNLARRSPIQKDLIPEESVGGLVTSTVYPGSSLFKKLIKIKIVYIIKLK